MPIILPTPLTAHETHRVSLNNIAYDITYMFNTLEQRWYIDLALQGYKFKRGIKLMENALLLRQYILSDYIVGDLFLVRNKEDGLPVGRYNLGTDKAYELLYLTPEEVAALEEA